MVLQPYQYEVQHLPGRDNCEADTLSRTWDDGIPTSGPFRGRGCWDLDDVRAMDDARATI